MNFNLKVLYALTCYLSVDKTPQKYKKFLMIWREVK